MNLSFPERIRVDAIIQAAMDMEAAPLLHALTPIGDDETPQALLAGTHKTQRYALGELDGKTVLVVTSGIGLANAASATARALTRRVFLGVWVGRGRGLLLALSAGLTRGGFCA